MADIQEWSLEELRASIEAYLDMLHKELSAQRFTKKAYYEDLAKRFGRTPKAFEYRMQNISYVRSILGRTWISGLKPAKNVGSHVADQIEAIMAEIEGSPIPPQAGFENEVKRLRGSKLSRPKGNTSPKAYGATVKQFERDPSVKAWVLQEAKGRCEVCLQPAPFNDGDGLPFLEVHHVHPLADGGADTVENAIAVCPNCHRELHYGEGRQMLLGQIYERVERIVVG